MVRPRHRGNRLLRRPGISADPRARALAATLVVTPRAHSEVRTPLLPRHCLARPSSICLLLMSHCIARPSSICLLPMSLGCLHLRVPFYLLLVSHCIARPSICLLPMLPDVRVSALCLPRAYCLSLSLFLPFRCHAVLPLLSPGIVLVDEPCFLYVFIYLVDSCRLIARHCFRSACRLLSTHRASLFGLVVTAGAEGRKGYQTRWRVRRIKGWAR
jgi:hypothetical protein